MCKYRRSYALIDAIVFPSLAFVVRFNVFASPRNCSEPSDMVETDPSTFTRTPHLSKKLDIYIYEVQHPKSHEAAVHQTTYKLVSL